MHSKKEWERIHARRRARERLNIKLSNKLRAILITDIKNGRAEMIKRQSARVTLWRIKVGKKRAIVVYDSHREEIVTFLKSNWR